MKTATDAEGVKEAYEVRSGYHGRLCNVALTRGFIRLLKKRETSSDRFTIPRLLKRNKGRKKS